MTDQKKNNVPPVENTELEKVLKELKEDGSPEVQNHLSEKLKDAQLLSACSFDVVKGADGKPHMKSEQVKFFLLNTKDGKTYFPAFTSLGRCSAIKFNEDKPKFVVNKIAVFAKMLADPKQKAAGIILNPGTDNVIVPRNLVLMLAGLIKPQAAPKPAEAPIRVIYGEPSVYPTKMVTAVYDWCAAHKEISRVWLKQKTAGRDISFVMVVEADNRDQKTLDGIQLSAEPLARNIPIEMEWYTEETEKKIVNGSVALYDRSLEL